MKRLIFGSLSLLLLTPTVLPAFSAETLVNSNNHQTLPSPQLIAQNMAGLMATDQDGTPSNFTNEQWLKANASVSVSAVSNDNYRVTVNATGLVPNGLYTFWWVNKKLVGMDMGPAGGVRDNSFRADANGNAAKTITVSADNNYEMLVVAYHADNKTHGEMPGEMGKATFSHLAGNFPKAN